MYYRFIKLNGLLFIIYWLIVAAGTKASIPKRINIPT